MAGLAASAAGQDGLVKVEIDGVVQTWDVGANPNIDLTLPSATTEVHIYDDAGDVNLYDSIGLITLRGTASGPVKVWIAGPAIDSFTAFVAPSQDLEAPGCRDILGLRFLPPVGSSDNSLLQHAVVSVNVLGDIGEAGITAGQIFRLDAKENEGATYGGTIWGDITAVRGDAQLIAPADAIAYVRARRAIRGAIVATGERDSNDQPLFTPTDRNTWGSITRVVVGGPVNGGIPSSDGFFGSIDCSYGILEELWTTGQVGEQFAPVSITAGVRVGRISVRPEDALLDGDVLAMPVHALIEASAQDIEVPYGVVGSRTSVSLLETEGDFHGTLRLHDFWGAIENDLTDPGPTRQAPGGPATGRKGIFVGGHCTATIDVQYNWEYGDMIAKSFSSITIGQTFKGAIVAVGEENQATGNIGTVTIGYGSLEGAPTRMPGETSKPGFSGIAYLLNPIFAPVIDGTPAQRRLWYTEPARDLNTIDSVIRASDTIGKISVRAMSNQLVVGGGKTSKPRIEAPRINEMHIGAFENGAIWSGRLELDGQGESGPNFSNNYAIIGSATIDCMGPMADLWVKDTAVINILGDVFGEIRLPRLESYQSIRIGGRLGDRDAALSHPPGTGYLDLGDPSPNQFYGGQLSFWNYSNNEPAEDSPRGTWPTHAARVEPSGDPNYLGTAIWSRIVLEDPTSLNGQIIIDGSNTLNEHRPEAWKGDVVIGASTPSAPPAEIILSANESRAFVPPGVGYDSSAAKAPLYRIPSTVLGTANLPARGGAVGLVPFAVYGVDSNPTDPHSGTPIQAADFFAGLASVEAAFYGPIRLDDALLGPSVHKVNGISGASGPISPALFESETSGRVLTLRGNGGISAGQGLYRLDFNPIINLPDDRVLCDFTTDEVPVLYSTTYQWTLADPCPETCPCLGSPFCFVADYNGDDGIDGDDIIAFFADWGAANPAADVNFSGGVDGDDVTDFFCWWDINGGYCFQ